MRIHYEKFTSKRCFGIEMEVGNEVSLTTIATIIKNNSTFPLRSNLYKNSINNNYWDLKLDGSCGKNFDDYGMNEGGYEITSFKASGVKQLQHICKVAKHVKKSGVKPNINCGLHIHVDVSDFDEHDMGRLIIAWRCIESIILQAVPFRRRLNKYCMPFSLSKPDPKMEELDYSGIWNYYKPSHINNHSNLDRRKAMNLVNYCRSKVVKSFKRSTVEFRFPEGTLIESNIKNWTRLLVNFVSRIKDQKVCINKIEKYNLEKVLHVLGLGEIGSQNFCILSKGLRETKIWFLQRILRYDNAGTFYGDHDLLVTTAEDILRKMGVKHEN